MLNSFIDIAPTSHFPLENLPWGVFSLPPQAQPRIGVRLGDWVIDTAVLQHHGFFDGPHLQQTAVFQQPQLNSFMALGQPAWQEARATLQQLFAADNPTLRDDPHLLAQLLHPITAVQMHLPAHIGDYTDFYSSEHHARNVGLMFRPDDEPLLPNWKHLPVAYHGRSSSIVLSGSQIPRPWGQQLAPGQSQPHFAPSRELDFELEVGFFIGLGNQLGQPIPIEQAMSHIFGLVLVNDWSARDLQRWEYRPLGPFLAKNFATSISPWIVTLDALAPFQLPVPPQTPRPLPYLQPAQHSYDIELAVSLQTAVDGPTHPISRTNFRHLYWSMAQQLAHHAVNGCQLRPGDLLASGTISSPEPTGYGSLLELSWRGTRPLTLPDGRVRTFLEDGDQLTIEGWCQASDHRIGFGQLSGKIATAVAIG